MKKYKSCTQRRTPRVADQIQKELAKLIQLKMKDPRLGMVTVSAVKMSCDLTFANVFISVLAIDDQDDINLNLAIMKGAAGFLRSRLTKSIKLRVIPKLRFHYDSSLYRGFYVNELIKKTQYYDTNH